MREGVTRGNRRAGESRAIALPSSLPPCATTGTRSSGTAFRGEWNGRHTRGRIRPIRYARGNKGGCVRRIAIAVCLLVLGSTVLGQAGRGVIAGKVTTDQAHPAAGVTVQAKDTAAKISSVVTNGKGQSRLAHPPARADEVIRPPLGIRTP